MKKTILLLLVFVVLPASAIAVKAPGRKPYVGPQTVPAVIGQITYLIGYPGIDRDKYSREYKPRARFEFERKDVAFRRTRVKQDGSKTLEDVDILRFKYRDIKKLYYGKDAIEKAISGSFPTAPKTVLVGGYAAPLHEAMNRPKQSPVIVIYKQGGQTISLILLASHARAKALYNLLAKQARLRVPPAREY